MTIDSRIVYIEDIREVLICCRLSVSGIKTAYFTGNSILAKFDNVSKDQWLLPFKEQGHPFIHGVSLL
jgi:hypothetical protein